jgi:hypothetical protein
MQLYELDYVMEDQSHHYDNVNETKVVCWAFVVTFHISRDLLQ